jgi:hypothetical protein
MAVVEPVPARLAPVSEPVGKLDALRSRAVLMPANRRDELFVEARVTHASTMGEKLVGLALTGSSDDAQEEMCTAKTLGGQA